MAVAVTAAVAAAADLKVPPATKEATMRTTIARAATVLIAVTAGIFFASPAAAVPHCVDTAPNTTLCQTPGHAQISTSPDPAMTNSYPGWGFGGFGIGGGGIWFGGF